MLATPERATSKPRECEASTNLPPIQTSQDHALGTYEKGSDLAHLGDLTPDTPCRRATAIPSTPRPRPRQLEIMPQPGLTLSLLLSNLTSGNVVDGDSPNPVGHSMKIPRRNQEIQSQPLSIKCLGSQETTAQKALALYHLRNDGPISEATTNDQLARRRCCDLPLNPPSRFF